MSSYTGGAAPQLDPEVIERLRRIATGPPAERPRAPRFVPARLPAVLVAVLGTLGFLFVTAASSATEARRATEPRRVQLADLVRTRQDQVDQLTEEVAALRADVAAGRRAATTENAADAATAAARERLALEAGITPVHGPGVEVRLNDSSRPLPRGDEAEAYFIHDRDLQLIVNELVAAGAEAVAVNGVRLVATSPIRAAGDTITVGFRPVAPPYTIVAIGASRATFAASDVARQFGSWREEFGLGFRVRAVADLNAPGFAGRIATDDATPTAAR